MRLRLSSKRAISLFISASVLFATSMSVALLMSSLWSSDSQTYSLLLERSTSDRDLSLYQINQLRLKLNEQLDVKAAERKVQSLQGDFNKLLIQANDLGVTSLGNDTISNIHASSIAKNNGGDKNTLFIRNNSSLTISVQKNNNSIKNYSQKITTSDQSKTINNNSNKVILNYYSQQSLKYRSNFSCDKLFKNDSLERKKVKQFLHQNSGKFSTISSSDALRLTTDCASFRASRGYGSDAVTEEEKAFPLAFIILAHRDFEHLERLLRVLYRPQNVFCIHLDAKVDETLKAAVSSLVKCFHNVVLASSPQSIVYAGASRLMADIVCMKDLQVTGSKWRYLFQMAATELPLRTNLEMVQILKEMGGLNDVRETFQGRDNKRWLWTHKVINGTLRRTNVKNSPPPHNLTITKGMAYNIVSRDFVDWVLSDRRARDLLTWSHNTYSPDEHYWSTLNNLHHNGFLETPGGFTGHPDEKGYISRYINWIYDNNNHICYGKVIRHICTLSALDLPPLASTHQLAANKFDLRLDPIAYACVEDRLHRKTTEGRATDVTMYRNMWWIRAYKKKRKTA